MRQLGTLFFLATSLIIILPLCSGDNVHSDQNWTNFKTNLTQIQNLTSGLFPSIPDLPPLPSIPGFPFNISSVDDIIHQLFNITLIPTSTTALPPTNGSTTPAPTCQCGKGGKPKVPKIEYEIESEESAESIEDESESLEEGRESLEKKGDPTRIVHGVASNPNAWPWMGALVLSMPSETPIGVKLLQFCGGTLINSQYILTAAHCFNDFPNKTFITSFVGVILGSNSLKSNVTDRVASRIIDAKIHPKYNKVTFDNDIAVLKLAVPLTFTDNIRPICLSQIGTPFNGRKAIAAGWGTTKPSNGTMGQPYLREAGLRVISNAECKKFSPGLTRNMVCAQSAAPASNSNVCYGDSGGPLMVYKPKTKSFTQIGIVSHIPTPADVICGQKGLPAVHTRVNSYLNFIREVTSGTDFCSNSFS